MCIIYSCWDGAPNDKELEVGAERNSDGAGICWVDISKTKERKTNWIKGLDSSVKDVKAALKEHNIKYPYAIHYRSASIGPKCDELTHPFPMEDDGGADYLGGETRRVIMHNGTISDWRKWLFEILISSDVEFPTGPWNDSRAIAIAAAIKGEGIIPFIGGNSRILVMDSVPSAGHDKKLPGSYIRMFGSWEYQKERGFATSCAIPFHSNTQVNWRKNKGRHSPGARGGGATVTRIHEPAEPTGATWTVEELEGIASAISDEQRGAQILLGVGD